MNPWAAALGVASVPAVAGYALVRLNARERPQHALVLHSLIKRALLDCSYVRPRTFESFLSFARCAADSSTISHHLPETPTNTVKQRTLLLTFDDGLRQTCVQAAPLLTKYGVRATFFIITGLLGTRSGRGDVHGPQEYVTAEDIRELLKAGHEIGSHTVSHADVTRLSPQTLTRELKESKQRLEDITGAAVRSLSFPFGSWSARAWNVARDEGYEFGIVSRGRANDLPAGLLAGRGTYAFDSVEDLCAKAFGIAPSVASVRADIMSHFARGTSLWRFRKSYRA